MRSAHDDDAGKTTKASTDYYPQRRERLDDLEFSDFGRDPRYPPASWILPVLVMGLVAILFALFIL
jgi:hypothetical protein